MPGLSVEKLWVSALKILQAKDVFKHPCLCRKVRCEVDIEGIKLVATMSFLKEQS